MSITVDDGALITKDPGSIQTYTVDWSANLGANVGIATQTTVVAAVRPSVVDAALTVSTAPPLGITARTVAMQLTGGTLGQEYAVTNRIVTNESPAQTKERSFRVLIENQ